MGKGGFPKTITLKDPIEIISKEGEKRVITELTIGQSPKAKHFKGVKVTNMTFDDTLSLISRVCNEPMYVIEELGAFDMVKLAEEINSFLPNAGQ